MAVNLVIRESPSGLKSAVKDDVEASVRKQIQVIYL